MLRGAFPFALTLAACHPASGAVDEPAPATDGVEVPSLPAELHGTFVPADAPDGGRVLIVSADLLAALAGAESGAPRALRPASISCTDAHTCAIVAAGCRGRLHRAQGGALSVELEGDPGCAAFAGTFTPAQVVGTGGDVVVLAQAPPGHVLVGRVESPRAVDLEASRRRVEAELPRLDACYARALATAPDLRGELVLEVVQGSAAAQPPLPRIVRSEVGDTGLSDCVRAGLHGLKLPAGDDGLPAPVVYHLSFVPR